MNTITLRDFGELISFQVVATSARLGEGVSRVFYVDDYGTIQLAEKASDGKWDPIRTEAAWTEGEKKMRDHLQRK
jgi:hypothetical protein